MISIILGILFIAFTVFACIPFGPLAWGSEVISFLKGSLPVVSVLLAIICFFIGAADIKDKQEAKHEAEMEAQLEAEQNKDTSK
ncbi:MAG: hypothetical protein MJ188_04985 [Treponema sp.]|nr:hypothetical protein [Treponema sp.]